MRAGDFFLRMIAITSICVLPGIGPLSAEQPWPNWRGPFGDGRALDGNYPIRWTESEKIAWRLDLPDRGASTPVVAGDRILTTAGRDGKNLLQSISLEGKILWTVELGEEVAGKHAKASGANSSPVTDGERVVAYFKSGDLACCDLQGKILWQDNLQKRFGEDSLWWDLGTSPILVDGLVVVAVMQTGPSYLVAYDLETGQVRWKTDRMMESIEESHQAYTTPVVARIEGTTAIITLGADHATAHRAADGKLLWSQGGFNPGKEQYFRTIASPVLAGDLVLCPYARGATLTALRTSGEDGGRQAWRLDLGADVPTPAVTGNRVYLCGDKGLVSCLEAATGKILWQEALPKSRHDFSSSPVIAGDHVYLTREDGTTFVIRHADSFDLVATNPVDSATVATPVFAHGRIFLRTYDAILCIAP